MLQACAHAVMVSKKLLGVSLADIIMIIVVVVVVVQSIHTWYKSNMKNVEKIGKKHTLKYYKMII